MLMVNEKPLVIGIGELLWDIFPGGKKMGGAPANVIYHAVQSGCNGHVISSVGADNLGDLMVDEMAGRGLSADYITRDEDHPSGTVSVTLDTNGSPSYVILENVAWDNIRETEENSMLVEKADAVCFGSLAQRSNVTGSTITSLLGKAGKNTLKVFDLNLRQKFYSYEVIERSLELSNVLKLNNDELEIIAGIFSLDGTDHERLEQLSVKYDIELIALTKGSDSSIIFTLTEQSTLPSPRVNVVDTVGAGDCFTAVLIAGMLNNNSLREIHERAVDLSAWVCTQHGATPGYNIDPEKFKIFN